MVRKFAIVNSCGTRNFVLSRFGRVFSLWYLSTMIGILVGNLARMRATSSFRVAKLFRALKGTVGSFRLMVMINVRVLCCDDRKTKKREEKLLTRPTIPKLTGMSFYDNCCFSLLSSYQLRCERRLPREMITIIIVAGVKYRYILPSMSLCYHHRQ